ncbi:MAG: glycosyltransferase family 9 protein [Cyclobacteriaceae bacterium]|nr:glycosyltransferase family 9 protein [Cyclobacteriaceae bacterium]MDW8331970.1 glycosyltransferase family 9 protein [Cyclobacteriaceae bacterium]
MKKILLLRFSAMGDVLLLVPVVRSFTATFKDVEVTVATRPKFAAFFSGIERVKVFEADVDYRFTGFFGIRKLFFALLVKDDFDVVIDMHDHVRTMILRSLFRLFGKKVIVFNKGRKEKRAFTRKENKIAEPLPHTTERYRLALKQAGFDFGLQRGPWLHPNETAVKHLQVWLEKQGITKTQPWIGIAPFALHKTKIWPLANYPTLINELIKTTRAKFFLFGGGEKEISYFHDLKSLFPEHIVVVAGRLKLQQEIALMKMLDVMICTDSSNMHLAALSGTPVVSVWGGTHPDVGFGPLGQEKDGVLQIGREALPCRPCSVYGKETCHRGDFACLTHITVEDVVQKVTDRLRAATAV